MAPKSLKKSQWIQCELCGNDILLKDTKLHQDSNCDEDKTDFIKNCCLYGRLEYSNGECTNMQIRTSNLVFIGTSAGTKCNFVIGEPVILRKDQLPPIVRLMWPSKSSSSTSVILSSDGLEPSWLQLRNRRVIVETIEKPFTTASEIHINVNSNVLNDVNIEELTNLLKEYYGGYYVNVNNKLPFCFFGKQLTFSIAALLPITDSNDTWYKLSSETEWKIPEHQQKVKRLIVKLGGMDNIVYELKNLIEIALNQKANLLKTIQPICGVLLYGHSGTGKTAICKYLMESLPYYTVTISGTEVFSKYFGETEKLLKKLFDDAINNQPSIIFVDEIETICPKKVSSGTEQEKRVKSTFVSLIDSLHETQTEVFILTTTNKPEEVDSILRRFGRLDKEFEIPVPVCSARTEILSTVLEDIQHNLSQSEIKDIAKLAHGYVPADLINLCSQATMNALQRCKKHEVSLCMEDFNWGLSMVTPSAMREVLLEVPNVKWTDIGGLHDLKLKLKQAIEWPLKHADKFKKLGIKPPNGVLMYGPPGCSKTMIAKALATESGINFLSIKGPELFSKWVGESEKAVRRLFDKARQVAPSIIFFDEIDALGGERSHEGGSTSVHERVLAQLLTELDGVVPLNSVTIVAATNRPDRIDRALLRPGRIDRIVYVTLPDESTRYEILRLKLSTMCVSDNVLIDELVRRTEGFSGAEIHAICHESALKALEEDIDCEEVMQRHFDLVLHQFKPRTPQYLLDIYNSFSSNNRS